MGWEGAECVGRAGMGGWGWRKERGAFLPQVTHPLAKTWGLEHYLK